ncbi:EAL domain-containing protein [Rossellomorea aquimaris]|uniref:EAL domain-containing protein n=1 Tax=Rossellomorea aquimaris TaxID=189382 RepID=A0A5D4TI46_9BACI|nr:EAL domain-containing protein [Rossellomorea aquimaris]
MLVSDKYNELNIGRNKLEGARENQEIYHLFFQKHQDVVFVLDTEANILEFNDSILKYTGYSKAEVTGPFDQFVAADFQEEARQKFALAVTGETVSYDVVFVSRTGERVDLRMTHSPILDGDNILGVFGTARDATEFTLFKEKLSQTQKDLDFVQVVGNVGNWDYEVKSQEAHWSEQLYRIYGVEDPENITPSLENYLSMVHPEDRNEFMETCMSAYQTGTAFSIEYRIIRRDGIERIVHEQGNTIVDENGVVTRMIGTVHDITEYRRTEAMLEQSEAHAQMIFKNLNEIVWSIDIQNKKVLFCSEEFEVLCGYKLEDLIKSPLLWDETIYHEDAKKIQSIISEIRKGNEIFEQYRLLHSCGDIKWVDVKAIPTCDSEGNLVRLDGIMRDITDKKKSEETLHKAAFQDYLTQLPNRRRFEEYIEEQIDFHREKDESFALLYMDLDRFKFINDRLGHFVGDELLKQVTERLKNRSENQFTARLSGDEFAICLPRLKTMDQPVNVAKEIIDILEKPFHYGDYDLFISTSIGIGVFPKDGEDGDSLVKNADTALSYAKGNGKNTYQVYTREMNQESYRKYCLERDMRKAVRQDEFRVHFQPKVNVKNEEIIGAEALLRWEHEEWGNISPAEFIPIAEDSGFITEIGIWVLQDVCRQQKEWSERGFPIVPVCINISPQHFLKKDVVEAVQSNITQYDIEPSWIELEITETSLIHYSEVVQKTMTSLNEMGVKISLDDFGTGYSALSQLQNFKFDTLKIDQSFIKNVPVKSEDSVITKSLIEMAHGLGLDVVAEGVESKEQLEFLYQNHCDHVQGYIYSRPVPGVEFEKLMVKRYIQKSQ